MVKIRINLKVKGDCFTLIRIVNVGFTAATVKLSFYVFLINICNIYLLHPTKRDERTGPHFIDWTNGSVLRKATVVVFDG